MSKGTKWSWTRKENDAFNAIKDAITTEEVLAHYSPNKELVLQTDASGVGIGACLMQYDRNGKLQPIAYASRILNKTEQKYAQIERELLGLVFGVTKFRLYVLGRHFTLQTDHKPLTKLCNEKENIPL